MRILYNYLAKRYISHHLFIRTGNFYGRKKKSNLSWGSRTRSFDDRTNNQRAWDYTTITEPSSNDSKYACDTDP